MLPDHITFLTVLAPGRLIYRTGNQRTRDRDLRRLRRGRGQRDDRARRRRRAARQIDLEAARQAQQEAESALAAIDVTAPEFALARRVLDQQTARLCRGFRKGLARARVIRRCTTRPTRSARPETVDVPSSTRRTLAVAEERYVVESDVEVGRKDRDQHEDRAPCGDVSERGDEHRDPEADLGDARNEDERSMPRQVGRHHRHVHLGVHEVIHAGRNVEDDHDVQAVPV